MKSNNCQNIIGNGGGSNGGGITKGSVDGFVVKYEDPTHVDITAGIIEVDGEEIILSADSNFEVTSIPAAFDFIYFYLKKSDSTFYRSYRDAAPIAVPVYSVTKRGWYHPANTEDRMIGVCLTASGSSTLYFYETTFDGNFIKITFENNVIPELKLATNFNPTSNWQATTIASSTACSVNAVELLLWMQSIDTGVGQTAAVSAASVEYTAVNSNFQSAPALIAVGGIIRDVRNVMLGATRNIEIAGFDNDDNVLGAAVSGFIYKR